MADERGKEVLAANLERWYAADARREQLLQTIVGGQAGVSLRTIDWFVTNYAARKPVVYTIPETGRVVDVNGDYKDVLRCFHKNSFDSFKRRGSDAGEAAVRQRNFFKWAMENGVLEYVTRNATEIEQDMASTRATPRKVKRTRRRRAAATGGSVTISSQSTLTVPNAMKLSW